MRSPDPSDEVVLVDEEDCEIGTMEKVAAHGGDGILHRAVSACLFDERGRVLLQQRALSKYHFAGRWSNSCCTHPYPGEQSSDAIVRRLYEELAVEAIGLHHVGHFTYRAQDPGTGLVEWELDHVFVGKLVTPPEPHPEEVMDWRFVDVHEVPVDTRDTGWMTPWAGSVIALGNRSRT